MRTPTFLVTSLVVVGLCLGGLGATAPPVYADCVQSGSTVDCTGTDSDGYQAASGNLTVNVAPGAQVNNNGDALDLSVSTNNTVTNDGTLTTTGSGSGVLALDNNTLTNNHTIDAAEDGLNAEDGNTIVNAGAITADDDGIEADNNNTITNSGTLTSGDDGMDIDHNNTVTNSGTLNAGWDGVFGENGNTITNSGTLTAVSDGVDVDNGQVTNSGTIAAGGAGVRFDMDVEASAAVHNSGAITGSTAVHIMTTSAAATVTNSGTLTGTSGTAIQGDGADDTLVNTASGTVNGDVVDVEHVANSGTLNGDVTGSDANDGVFNAGTITGDVNLGAGNDRLTFGASGQIDGAIDGGAGSNAIGVQAPELTEAQVDALVAQIYRALNFGATVAINGQTHTWGTQAELRDLLMRLVATVGAENIVVSFSFEDGRLNGHDLGATVVVFALEGGGVELYTAQGDWAFSLDVLTLQAALAEAAAAGTSVEISAVAGVSLWASPDGVFVAAGPQDYTFNFTPDQCGAQ